MERWEGMLRTALVFSFDRFIGIAELTLVDVVLLAKCTGMDKDRI